MSFFLQAAQEIDIFIKIVNSAGILAALGYLISVERRLSHIEGRLSTMRCHASIEPTEEI